jgi:hypothetical protein
LKENEDVAYGKIISCTNVTKVTNSGKYLFKIKCKWESKVRWGTQPPPLPPEVSCKLKCKMRKWIESRNSNGAAVVVSVVIVTVIELTSAIYVL